jgi:L,D-transpeptidase catalytic domain
MLLRVWVVVGVAVVLCSGCAGGRSSAPSGAHPAGAVAADVPAPIQPVAATAWHAPARPRGPGAYLMARLRRPLHTRFGLVRAKTQFDGPVWVPVLSHRGPQASLLVPVRPFGRVVHADVRSLALRWSRIRVVVDLGMSRLTIFRGHRPLGAFPVGQGTALTPTPTGRFFVTDRLQFGFGSPYFPFALGLSAHQTHLAPTWIGGDQIAIHPGPMGHVSNGCIHVGAAAIGILRRIAPLGTYVIVRG